MCVMCIMCANFSECLSGHKHSKGTKTHMSNELLTTIFNQVMIDTVVYDEPFGWVPSEYSDSESEIDFLRKEIKKRIDIFKQKWDALEENKKKEIKQKCHNLLDKHNNVNYDGPDGEFENDLYQAINIINDSVN